MAYNKEQLREFNLIKEHDKLVHSDYLRLLSKVNKVKNEIVAFEARIIYLSIKGYSNFKFKIDLPPPLKRKRFFFLL